MKYTIISGSNRKDSGSRKVSDYLKKVIERGGADAGIVDMHDANLPMWTEDMWNPESEQSKNWQKYAGDLADSDAFVVVAAEWKGAISVSLKNFLTYLTFKEVAHKPAMIVSVSSGKNGVYPVSELRAYSTKNNGMLYIPDHVIVRNVAEVLDSEQIDENNPDDMWIKKRIDFSLQNLGLYAKHMKNLRAEADFDLEKYSFGM